MLLGAHVSAAGGVDKAPLNGKELGCEVIQIFTKSQLQWAARPLTKEEIIGFKQNMKATDMQFCAVHSTYLINLASPKKELLNKSRTAFLHEIERCDAIGADQFVFHPGAHTGGGVESGLKTITESLDWIIGKTEGSKTRLLIEITAGQGTLLPFKWEHIASVLEQVSDRKRLGVCFDTCHAFAAGYDIRTKDGYENVLKEIEKIIGLKRVEAFHLNDSIGDLGSHLDRHQAIGHGKIGKEFWSMLVNDRRFAKHPGYLETPLGDIGYVRDLKFLRSLEK
jgi:deoxyribonuclease-4